MTLTRLRRFTPQLDDYRWHVVGLLAFSVLINYIDRGNLSVAAPVLSRELSIPHEKLGLLFSAFFWTYALAQIPAGWLVDRFGVRALYAAAYLLWSTATLFTGFAHTIVALFFLRLLLGMGESVVYPVCSQFLVRNFQEKERGRANSIIDVGTKAGPALGTFIGGLVVAFWGWRVLFFAAGTVGLFWLLPWLMWSKNASDQVQRESTDRGPGMLEILSRRDTLGTSLGLFCYGYVWYFLLSWLPSYLVFERHFSVRAMAVFGAVPFCASGVSALVGGWLSDHLIAQGASVTRVRKGFVVSGLLICTLILPAASINAVPLAMILFTIACCGIGFFSSNVWAITQTLAGPLAAGKWSGMQNAAGNLGGVASPLLTGIILSRTQSFHLAFLSAAIMLLIGAAAYSFVVGEITPLTWKSGND